MAVLVRKKKISNYMYYKKIFFFQITTLLLKIEICSVYMFSYSNEERNSIEK